MLNRVNCSCDPGFHRSILYYPGPEAPFACMHCGAVTFSQVIGDDGRGGGEAWTSILVMDMPPDVVEWFGLLPRRTGMWEMEPECYLGASERFKTVAALLETEQKRDLETKGWSSGRKIRAAGVPVQPPPKDIGAANPYYIYAWEALQMDQTTPVETLLNMAKRSDFLLGLLEDLFFSQPDINALISNWLHTFEDDLYWYTRTSGDPYFVAIELLRRQKEPAPEHIAEVLEYLQTVSLEKNPYYSDELKAAYRIKAALKLIETCGPQPEVIRTLSDLKKRVGIKGFQTYKDVDAVLKRLIMK